MAYRYNAPKITTPRVTFSYPKITEPDYGSTQHPDPDGSFKVNAILKKDSPEFDFMIKKLQPLFDEALAEAHEAFKELKVDSRRRLEKENGKGGLKVNDLYTETYDEETEEPTGDVIFKFKTKAGGTIKSGPKKGKEWSRSVPVFDAKGRLMKTIPAIWGGTVGKISFKPTPYFISGSGGVGLKLNLDAVQIIALVSGGAGTADSYGFGEEEGYEYDPSPPKGPDADDDDEFDKPTPEGDDGAENF